MNDSKESSSEDHELQQYATDLLSESLVTGVPAIVKAPTWPRKIFKLCALFLCLSGFLYQTTEFLSFVFTYPSAVDIEVETPTEIMSPALTICNNNGIERTKFCEVHREKCEFPANKTAFCLEYPENCDRETDREELLIPKPEHYTFEENATIQDFKNLSLERDMFFNITLNTSTLDIRGPFVLYKKKKRGTVCYTINSCVKNCADPIKMSVFGSWIGRLRDPKMTIELTFDKSESFLPGRDAGGWISLHSPYETSNPYYQGHFLRPNHRYSVIFHAEIEELLEHPYRRNCRNYDDSLPDSAGRRPTSKMVCRELCDLKLTMQACNNCSDKSIDYPQDDDGCYRDFMNCPGRDNYSYEDYSRCSTLCTDECVRYKFPYSVEERPLHEVTALYSEVTDHEKKTTVELYLADEETIVFRHRPHYQEIEVFSYIGGYIGAWLGISLVAVTDFFESLFHIAVYAFRKNRLKNAERKTRNQ